MEVSAPSPAPWRKTGQLQRNLEGKSPRAFPNELLQYLSDVQDDESLLKKGLVVRNNLLASYHSGKVYKFYLESTGEEVDVDPYAVNGILKGLRASDLICQYHWIAVAKGSSLKEPVIISRQKDWPNGLLQAWRGRQGYDNTIKIVKGYEDGVKFGGRVSKRSKKSPGVVDESEDEGTSKDEQREEDRGKKSDCEQIPPSSAHVERCLASITARA